MLTFEQELVEARGHLRAWAMSFAKNNRATADDLLQETMLCLWQRQGRFNPEKRFLPWAHQVMLNCFRGMLRQMGKNGAKEMTFISTEEAAEVRGYDVDPEKRAQVAEVFRAVRALPSDYQAAIWLMGVNGMTETEAGRALNMPAPAVRKRLFRARQRLRLQFNGD